MSSAMERMRRAYDNEQPTVVKTAPTKAIPETKQETAPVIRQPKPAPKKSSLPVTDIPTAVRQIARPDVDLTIYGAKSVATNFNCYNRDLWTWLTTFSSANQFNGGNPITKSQLIEISLDVVMYDLDINPVGYESQQELREAIQKRIREIT